MEATVTGLIPNTTYRFTVKARNGSGTGETTQTILARTGITASE
jgi:chitodextrinase